MITYIKSEKREKPRVRIYNKKKKDMARKKTSLLNLFILPLHQIHYKLHDLGKCST